MKCRHVASLRRRTASGQAGLQSPVCQEAAGAAVAAPSGGSPTSPHPGGFLTNSRASEVASRLGSGIRLGVKYPSASRKGTPTLWP